MTNITTVVQTGVTQDFDELVAKLVKSKIEFDNLQKEIAVKVIESGSSQIKPQPQAE